MTQEELLYEMKNADKRNTRETLGGMFGGLVSGATLSSLPYLYNMLAPTVKLPKIPFNLNPAKVIGIGGALGGGLGAALGGGFNQGLDTGATSLIGLPINIIQANQARKSQKLDELYNRLRIENQQM